MNLHLLGRRLMRELTENSAIRKFDGALTLFRLKIEDTEDFIPLYEWENPFILANIQKQLNKETIRVKFHGEEYKITSVKELFRDRYLEKLVFSIISKEKRGFLEWDGREILVFSIFRVTNGKLQRQIELMKTVSLPFGIAEILLQSGRKPVDDRRIPIQRIIVSPDNLDNILVEEFSNWGGERLREKILSPLILCTEKPYEILKGLSELGDHYIILSRLAIYILHILNLVISKAEEIDSKLWDSLQEKEKERILMRAAELFWLNKPLLRNDPICPKLNLFQYLIVNAWRLLRDEKERLNSRNALYTVIRYIESTIDLLADVIRLKEMMK